MAVPQRLKPGTSSQTTFYRPPSKGIKEFFVFGKENHIRITDVAPTLYTHKDSRRFIENIEQIQEDLWTWWAEADLRPSPIRLFTKNDHLEDKYGNDLVLQAQAAGVVRKGRVEQERVEAEILGVTRLREILLSSEARDGAVYLSPPGTPEEGFGAEGRRRLSFTYLYHVGNAGRIHFLAVPELEVPVEEHFGRTHDLVNREKTAKIVGEVVGELNNRTLVAYPFVNADQHSLDLLAKRLGYNNLLDLWRQALEAKRLRGRAGELIKHASGRVWEAYQGRENDRLEVLGDVFRGVVALLVSDGLHDVEDIHTYFDSKVSAILGSQQVDGLGGVSAILYEPHVTAIQEFYFRLRNNSKAMGIIEGGSCPGDRGLGFGQHVFGKQGEFMPSNNILLDTLGEGVFEKRSSEENYSFDHEGECVVCKKDPRKLGPCNICEQCDHQIRQQAG